MKSTLYVVVKTLFKVAVPTIEIGLIVYPGAQVKIVLSNPFVRKRSQMENFHYKTLHRINRLA
jgi:hypothetical protein